MDKKTKKPSARILVVEDEPDMVAGLRDNLQFKGYDVVTAQDGESAVEKAVSDQPHLVLLDIMLPKLSGFEVCSKLRENEFRAPILMLSARGQEVDKVRGLELGADDYITKPFSIAELLARVKAALRRTRGLNDAQTLLADDVNIGQAQVSFTKSKITRGRRALPLGHYESEILRLLLKEPGQVVSREALLGEIFGVENEPTNRSVDNHIVSLRRKIESNPSKPKHLVTVHGFGYKYIP